MAERITRNGGNIIDNKNTQYIKASNSTGEKQGVKVTKGGDLRARG